MTSWIVVNNASGNGLAPVRHQAIAWTNGDVLTIGPLDTKIYENRIKIQHFSIKKVRLKMPSEMSSVGHFVQVLMR